MMVGEPKDGEKASWFLGETVVTGQKLPILAEREIQDTEPARSQITSYDMPKI